jgi:hypothetical protein
MIARIVTALVALVLVPLLASADDHELRAKAAAKARALFCLHDTTAPARAAACTCAQGTGTCPCVECDCAIATGKLTWFTDNNAAVAEARRTGKPILILCGSIACPPCHVLKSRLTDPKLAGVLKGFVLLKLDDRHDLASAMGVTTYPTLLHADSDGTVRRTWQAKDAAVPALADWMSRKTPVRTSFVYSPLVCGS